jgi:U3 small nucleolar ribonucleoprotein protein IMP3
LACIACSILNPDLTFFYHRLLKKTDLYTYKSDQGHRAGEIQRKYGITDVEYNTYNALCGSLRKMAHKLSQLEPEDPTRRKLESAMLEKLHSIGIIEKSREQGGALSQVEHLTVSAICRRRLPIVMVREQKMIQFVDKVSFLFFRSETDSRRFIFVQTTSGSW